MEEAPEYIIRPSIGRILVPKVLITLVLAIIFYFGILLNVMLLEIQMPAMVTTLILSVMFLLVIIQGLLSYLQTAKIQYFVFRNRIQSNEIKAQYIMFNAVQSIKDNTNIFDKMFGTGTLVLEPGVTLTGIPNFQQTSAYIRQMIQYSRAQYQQQ